MIKMTPSIAARNIVKPKGTLLWALLLCLLMSAPLSAQNYKLQSLDKDLEITIHTVPGLSWSLSYKGKPIMERNKMALELADGTLLGKRPVVTKALETLGDNTITPVVPVKNASFLDQYKQLRLEFKGGYALEFRAYPEGVAYRFVTDRKGELTVNNEIAEMNFVEKTTSLFPKEDSMYSHYERDYLPVALDTLPKEDFASLPVLATEGQVRVLITEADLYDYPGMFLYGNHANGFTAGFPKAVKTAKNADNSDRVEDLENETYIAKTSGKRNFPWRAFVVSDDDKVLVSNELVFKLSRPLALTDTDWIKPGKVAWDWYNANNIFGVDFKSGINTETYKYYIDFAAKYGLEYIILDEGWSKTTTNVLEPSPDVDIPTLVAYGKEKGVGLILWSLWKPVDENKDKIFALYEQWGIKGIKIDFMQRADQQMVNFYERTVKEAAKHHLLIDYHGAYKPSGLRRAYPNLVNYEGVRGNENNKWGSVITPEHTVTLPFTRMVAGPMDFTPGAVHNVHAKNFKGINDRPMALGTRCHQVSMYVLYDSPLQMLCDSPSAYYKEPETTAFIAKMPTTWDQTVVLDAKVGDYLLMARRKGTTWYVGAMTDGSARDLDLDLSFLPIGSYSAEIMEDGINADRYAEDYKKVTEQVGNTSHLKIHMAPGGGWAAIITQQ